MREPVRARRTAAVLRSAVVLVLLSGWTPLVRGASHVYSLELPADRAVTFELNLEPQHPGPLRVDAVWSGARILALRLEPSGGGATLRRSGASPLSLEAQVEPGVLGSWRLVIHSLAARAAGEGRLTVELPDPPELVEKRAAPAAPPPPPPDPWLLPRKTPAHAGPEVAALYDRTERLRSLIAGAVGRDSCGWQEDLLRYLVERGDDAAAGKTATAGPTRRFLQRVVEAVDRVEEYRTSKDPLISGPPPEDDDLRAAWQRMRGESYQELEELLDEVLQSSRVDHLSDLREEGWPVRIASCVSACERHFEELGRIGEDRATNRDLAQEQWAAILAAAGALDSLLRVDDEPAIRLLRGE